MNSDTREPPDHADVVHFQVNPSDLRGRPGDQINAIAQQLAEGRRVELSPSLDSPVAPKRGPSPASLDRATNIVIVLAGGVALGGLSVAVAPASIAVAAVASDVGMVLSTIGVRLDEKHSRQSTRAK